MGNVDQHPFVKSLRCLSLTPARLPSENTSSRLNQSLLKMAQEQDVKRDHFPSVTSEPVRPVS